MSALAITSSYAFLPFTEEQLVTLQKELKALGTERGMNGLVLLAPEGINSTVCGTPETIADWKEGLRMLKSDILFKDSFAEQPIFRRWSVKIKPELITFKQPGIAPAGKHKHLSPQEWKQMMEREDVVVVDARNGYEVGLGKFRSAVDPQLKHFQDFPEAIKSASIPKEKTVMLYCTGGIRCEKAVPAMEAQGYSNVYQLEGGILAYLEQYPDDAFEGECFVFDHRVAVDQHLQPSKTYHLCSECGDPARSVVCGGCAGKLVRTA
ncbi:MAG: hypothetical protein HOO67_05390 [Candidatus Peribacteraceae bacterium]|nr:hypothetical protein [Candidatus Peribacteraceae bacterium]